MCTNLLLLQWVCTVLVDRAGKKQYFFETKRRIFRFVRHFWVVLLIFSFLGILLGRQEVIPGTLEKFLGNVFLYNLNYNGAWWFILTYIFLLLLSKGLYQIVSRIYWLLTIILFSAVYVVAYIFRFRCAISFDHTVINWIWAQTILVGTSLLRQVKSGTLIINASRGEVVDEEALLASGLPYVLDVWEHEPWSASPPEAVLLHS